MKRFSIIFCIALMALASCDFSGNKKPTPSHFPFKEGKNDRWGLITANGKILIEDEFENAPYNAINGIFFVEDNKGDIEMYSIKNPRKPIGDSYVSIAPFYHELTPCAKSGEGIKYINKEGQVKFILREEYLYASAFVNGYSIITKFDESSGKNVNDAFSTDGSYLALKRYSICTALGKKLFLAKDEDEDYYIIDQNGSIKNRLIEFPDYSTSLLPDEYSLLLSPNNKYYVYQNEEGSGIRSINGEIIIKAKDDRVCFFLENNKVAFYNYSMEDGIRLGVMDLKGNILLKAKYSDLILVGKNHYIVEKDDKYGVINEDEAHVIPFNYATMGTLAGKAITAMVNEDDSKTLLLSKTGKVLGYYSYIISNPKNSFAANNYLDVTELISSVMRSSEGNSINDFYGYKGLSPKYCTSRLGRYYNTLSDIGYDNSCLPSEYLKSTAFGSAYYSLGFNEVLSYNSYYDSYSFNDYSTCNKLTVTFYLSSNVCNRKDFIKSQLQKAMADNGFLKDNDYYDDLHYYNSSIYVYIEVYEGQIVLTATPK